MDAKIFNRMYGLFWRKYMKVFPLPSYCVNPCCNGWSSPAYCYHRYMIGKAEYPVCPRSAALYNLRKLPAPPKQLVFKQLVLTFE